MEQSYIDLHLATDRYLQGSLSERELHEFEERLVWDADLVSEVELAEQLRAGLKAAAEAGHLSAPERGFLTRLWNVPVYAAAASFVVAVGLTSIAFLSMQGSGPPDRSYDVDIVPLVALRSAAPVDVEVHPDAATLLMVDATDGYPSYRIKIVNTGGNETFAWQREGIVPGYPQSLRIVLPPGALQDGRYVLSVDGELANVAGDVLFEHIRDITFQVSVAD